MLLTVINIVLSANCFFNEFHEEALAALNFFETHKEIQRELLYNLSNEEKDIAKAIVAPEVGFYSYIEDYVEYKTMCLLYIQYGTADFSIGSFQMKPSFAETIENEICKNRMLKKKYAKLIIKNKDSKKCRKIRIDRLTKIMWQTKYLSAFIDISRIKTFNIKFNDVEDKIKYWAILYNSGLDLSESRVYKMQERKLFPRFYGGYNYADVVLEFYHHMVNK